MNKKREYLDYNDFLNDDLKDSQEAIAYLKEALQDEDERVFLLALKHVIDAQGENISQLAKDADLNRENLYKVFSKRGNPKWGTINSILRVIGLELTVQPYKK